MKKKKDSILDIVNDIYVYLEKHGGVTSTKAQKKRKPRKTNRAVAKVSSEDGVIGRNKIIA